MPSKKLKGKLAYVANPSSDDANGITCFSGVGFPGDCVFLFDETLFESLEISVGVRRPQQLARLWAKATPLHRDDKIAA